MAEMSADQGGPVTFVNPDTGETYNVKPAKVTIAAAWKLGFLPLSAEDHERADAIEAAHNESRAS